MLPVVACVASGLSLYSSLIAALPAAIVNGLTLEQPGVWNDSDFNTLTWTTAPGDPATFSVDLLHPSSLSGGSLNVLSNVKTADGKITFNLPAVPEGGNYTIVAHPVGNDNEVLFKSTPFKIEETRIPNATQSNSASGTVTPPSTPTQSSGFGAGIPSAPSNAPTFPGDDSPDSGDDGLNGALGVRPFAGLAALVAGAVALML
ncbi:hypothetical protein AURDEDRAFT_123330 [Auricularia subglabra TFB-10046 SS5]|nr:hypothetical protein AURDEDRAFT_123330 [Auricularia subglabra TFB-10046 SS5]